MQTTFKFIIDKVHPRKDLICPVRVRFYQERIYKEYSLGLSVLQEEWNENLQQVFTKNKNHLSNKIYLTPQNQNILKIKWLGKTNLLTTLIYNLWKGQDNSTIKIAATKHTITSIIVAVSLIVFFNSKNI